MKRTTIQISLFFVALMAYYILPEHYLLMLHPHEHKSHCCAAHAKEDLTQIAEWERQCPEKENYKQVFDYQFVFHPEFNQIHFKKIKTRLYSGYYLCFADSLKARAPPEFSGT